MCSFLLNFALFLQKSINAAGKVARKVLVTLKYSINLIGYCEDWKICKNLEGQ